VQIINVRLFKIIDHLVFLFLTRQVSTTFQNMDKPDSITDASQNGTTNFGSAMQVDEDVPPDFSPPTERSNLHDPERRSKEFKARHIQMMALGPITEKEKANSRCCCRFWTPVAFWEGIISRWTNFAIPWVPSYGDSTLFCLGIQLRLRILLTVDHPW